MSRQSANIGVYHAGESVPFFQIPITPSSVRRRKLMEENCCVFEFVSDVIIPFSIGDKIEDDNLGGTFYITEEQEPAVITDGGYRYRVQFNAPEYLWNNFIYCLTTYQNGEIKRNDSVFNITDNLFHHVGEIIRNLECFDIHIRFCIDGEVLYSYNKNSNSFDASSALELPCGPYDGVEKAESVINASYSGTSLYKAIQDLAEAYSCEFWYNQQYNVLFFGHCQELQEEEEKTIDFNAADETKEINIQSLSAQKNENEYANKIYVYGSTKNIPDTYRKELKLKADTVFNISGIELVGNRTYNYSPIATGGYNTSFVSRSAFPVTPGEKYTFLLSCGGNQTLACLIGCAYKTLSSNYAQVLYRGNTTTPTEQTITIPSGVNYLFISSLKSVNPYIKHEDGVAFLDSNKPFSPEMIKNASSARSAKIIVWEESETGYVIGGIGKVSHGDFVTISHKPYEATSISYTLLDQDGNTVGKTTEKSVSSDKSTVCTCYVPDGVTNLSIRAEEPSEHFNEKSNWEITITPQEVVVSLYFPERFSWSVVETQEHYKIINGEIVPYYYPQETSHYYYVIGPVSVTPNKEVNFEIDGQWPSDVGVYYLINGEYVYSHSFHIGEIDTYRMSLLPPLGASMVAFETDKHVRSTYVVPIFKNRSSASGIYTTGKFLCQSKSVSIDGEIEYRKTINNNGEIVDIASGEDFVVNKIQIEPNTIIKINHQSSESNAMSVGVAFYDANDGFLQKESLGFVRTGGESFTITSPSNAASIALFGYGAQFWVTHSFTIGYWYNRNVFTFGDYKLPDWFDEGIPFRPTDASMNLMKVPSSYYDQSDGDVNSIRILGEPRLRLPLQNNTAVDYVPNERVSPDKRVFIKNKIVEKVVFFENVYPSCALRVSEVETQSGVMKEYELSDGSVVKYQGTRYSVKLKLITVDGDVEFPFNKDMLLSSAPLQLTFITPSEEMEYSDGEPHGDMENGYKLCGMSFGVEWDQTGQKYIISWNTEYGAQLPNENLMPVVGDPVLLSGWNVKGMSQLGLIDAAEEKLEDLAAAYLEAIEEEQFTFDCNMMSDWAKRVGVLPIGKNVAVCYGVGKVKKSRILGYELKLDIPYDTPKYIVGETDVYSRLRRLEKKVNAQEGSINSNGAIVVNVSGGGGGGGGEAVLPYYESATGTLVFDY